MENTTILSWLKTAKRLKSELEQCERSLYMISSNPKLGVVALKSEGSPKTTSISSKWKDRDNDILLFHQFFDEVRKERSELSKQRENSKQQTLRRIVGLKILFDAIREKISNLHLVNKAAQNNFQDMLETFENKLTSFKQSMKAEFDTMDESESTLVNEISKLNVTIDDWNNSSPPSPSNFKIDKNHSASDDSNPEKAKKNLEDRRKKEVDRKAIIGTLDRKIATIGRYGGWDPRDHDAFLKNWNQAVGLSMDQFLNQLERDEQSPPQEEQLQLPAALKQTLLKKMDVTLPGKATPELEDHVNWYLKYLYLTLLKKKVVSEWKRETEQARCKQSEEAFHAELGISLGDKSSVDSAEEGEQAEAGGQASRNASEEERLAAKEKLARWKAEKQRQAETEKQEKLALLEDEKRRAEDERKKRAQEKLQVEEWRRAEQLAAETAKEAARQQALETSRPNTGSDFAEALAERQKKALEAAKSRHAKVDSALQKKLERERRMKEAGEVLKLSNKKEVSRSLSRMQSATRASDSARITVESLDDAGRRRRSVSAHSAPVAMSGRDLQFSGRVLGAYRWSCEKGRKVDATLTHIDSMKCLKISDFDSKVYSACKKIPKGKVATYKILAEAIGHPNAYRAVGSSLRKNPFAPEVPCHRVIATDRSLGGFYGSKDVNGSVLKKKTSMLLSEGVLLEEVTSSIHRDNATMRVCSQCIILSKSMLLPVQDN